MSERQTYALLLAFISMLSTNAEAAEPYCPGYTRTFQAFSATVAGGASYQEDLESHPVDHRMYPCDTVSVTFSVTNLDPDRGAVVSVALGNYGGSNYAIENETVQAGGSASVTIPGPQTQFRGYGGPNKPLYVARTLYVGHGGPSLGVSVTATITLTSRPGYNRSTSDSADALTLTSSPVTLLGTLHSAEQIWYLVHLPAQGTVTVAGTASAVEPQAWGYLAANFFDLSGTHLGGQAATIPAAGQGTLPATSHTNTSAQTQDVLIRFDNGGPGLIDTFNITATFSVAPQPPAVTLKLFLDVEPFQFNAASPATTSDDPALYVPGSDMNGASVPVAIISGTGQPLRIYAAYVDPANTNQIVAPPQGVAGVVLSLPSVSQWRGYAMNAGSNDDTGPDFLLDGQTSVTFGGSNVVMATLLAKDYGGSVTVLAQPVGSDQSPIGSAVEMHLPKDDNGNLIADYGWMAGGGGAAPVRVADLPAIDSSWSDTDDADIASDSPFQPPTYGRVGDGIIRFEEYRGFVIQGVHTRTNPNYRDLFVVSTVTSPETFLTNPTNGLTFAATSLKDNNLRLHQVDPEEAPIAEARLINARFQYGQVDAPPNTPGWIHRVQLALGVQAGFVVPRPIANPNTYVLGITTGTCINTNNPTIDGGQMVADFQTSTIDVERIRQRAAVKPVLTVPDQINNEIRRTIGHEIGHGIHVMHRGDVNTCGDGAATGNQKSLMTSDWGNGAGASDNQSKYNTADVKQMRLHHYDAP